MNEECTGIAASWCPIHGDCSCARWPSGERIQTLLFADGTEYDDDYVRWDGGMWQRAHAPTHALEQLGLRRGNPTSHLCPLHAADSTHAD